jgi:hypothetical protein
VSRQKQLITVFVVANAQKQGAENTECIEVGYATMFQVINVKARILIYWYLNINKEGNRDNEKKHQRHG